MPGGRFDIVRIVKPTFGSEPMGEHMKFADDPIFTEPQRMSLLRDWVVGNYRLGDGSGIYENGRWLPVAMLRLEDRHYVREVLVYKTP